MKKKFRMTVFLSLVCVGIIGVLFLKNGQKEVAVIANHDQEVISGEVGEQTGESDGQVSSTQESTKESSEETNTTTETKNNDKDEQINGNEDVTNDASQHIDINMEEIIAIVGEDVYNFDSEKISQMSNPNSLYVLVNKNNNLPSDYVPEDLVVPNVAFSFNGDDPKKQMRKEAADALELLFTGASDQGLNIYAISGYRSYSKQVVIYNGNVNSQGEEAANRVSAKPGQSEHQTGLAMDVSSQSAGLNLVAAFGDTKEGKWLAVHAHEYGFIIRYPEDKTDITKYSYEPWHVRYVGVTLATQLYEKELTLEEFYEQLVN